MLAVTIDLAQFSRIPGLNALNCIEDTGSRGVALMGIWGKGGT
jgi:hypothetical protein